MQTANWMVTYIANIRAALIDDIKKNVVDIEARVTAISEVKLLAGLPAHLERYKQTFGRKFVINNHGCP